GRLLVSVGEDQKVIVWNFEHRKQLAIFTDHTEWIASVAFLPGGKWFATASYDKTVIVWDAINLRKEAVLRNHRGKVLAVAFSPDNQTLVSSADQNPLNEATILWRVGTWEKFAQIPYTRGDVNSLIFPPRSGHLIFHSDIRMTPNTWDVATGQPVDSQFDPSLDGNNAALS